METYFANQPLSISIPLSTSNGNVVLDPTDVTYRVLDATGYEFSPAAPVAVVAGSGMADIAIDGIAAQLQVGEVRSYRQIEVTFKSAGVTHICYDEFLIELMDSLIVMVNSFQTYGDAAVRCAEITGLESFASATRRERITALSNAYITLSRLEYQIPPYYSPVRIQGLSEYDFEALHQGLTSALKMAQVIEANEALDSFSILKKRQQGLMSETIGESSMMFRPEKVLNVPMTRRGMDLLRPYLVWNMSIGRG